MYLYVVAHYTQVAYVLRMPVFIIVEKAKHCVGSRGKVMAKKWERVGKCWHAAENANDSRQAGWQAATTASTVAATALWQQQQLVCYHKDIACIITVCQLHFNAIVTVCVCVCVCESAYVFVLYITFSICLNVCASDTIGPPVVLL